MSSPNDGQWGQPQNPQPGWGQPQPWNQPSQQPPYGAPQQPPPYGAQPPYGQPPQYGTPQWGPPAGPPPGGGSGKGPLYAVIGVLVAAGITVGILAGTGAFGDDDKSAAQAPASNSQSGDFASGSTADASSDTGSTDSSSDDGSAGSDESDSGDDGSSGAGGSSTPAEAADELLSAMEDGSESLIRLAVCAGDQTADQLSKLANAGLTDHSLRNTKTVDSERANVYVTLSLPGKPSVSDYVPVIRQGGAWLACYSSESD